MSGKTWKSQGTLLKELKIIPYKYLLLETMLLRNETSTMNILNFRIAAKNDRDVLNILSGKPA